MSDATWIWLRAILTSATFAFMLSFHPAAWPDGFIAWLWANAGVMVMAAGEWTMARHRSGRVT